MTGHIDLLEEEKEQILKQLPSSINKEDRETILDILSKAHCTKGMSGEEDISSADLKEVSNHNLSGIM